MQISLKLSSFCHFRRLSVSRRQTTLQLAREHIRHALAMRLTAAILLHFWTIGYKAGPNLSQEAASCAGGGLISAKGHDIECGSRLCCPRLSNFRPPQSGRIEARTGLRMMPTFPQPPYHSVRRVFAGTASIFPPTGRLKPAPGIYRLMFGLCLPCAHGEATPQYSRTASGGDVATVRRHGGGVVLRPRGPCSCPVVSNRYRPHPPHHNVTNLRSRFLASFLLALP
jgi:hypothetical protein